MFKKLLLAALLAFLALAPADAQNPQCPNRPAGDSTNACANTRFVTQAIAALPVSVSNVQYLQTYINAAGGDTRVGTNAAIAAANAGGGNTAFLVKCGDTTWTGTASLTAITASNVFFVGECEGGSNIISTGNTTNGLFVWGNTVTQPDGGGFANIRFTGNGSGTQLMINLINAARWTFNETWLSNIGQILLLGDGTRNAQGVHITNMIGYFGNVATIKIECRSGSGLFLDNVRVFSDAANVAAITNGSNFLSCVDRSWDTIQISNSIFERFAFGVYLQAGTGNVINNITIANTKFDAHKFGLAFVSNHALGTIYAVNITSGLITGEQGDCLEFSGPGINFGHLVTNSRIQQCGNHGIDLGGTVALTKLEGNHIYGVNKLASASNGINVANGTTNLTIDGNNVGAALAAPLDGTPTNGIVVGTATNANIVGNTTNGATAGCSIGTLTTGMVRGNIGTGCTDKPDYTGTGAILNLNTATLPVALTGTILRLANADAATSRMELISWATNPSIVFRRANTTAASPSALVAGNIMGSISFAGYQGTTPAYTTTATASWICSSTETWTSTAQGSNCTWATTPATTATAVNRMTLNDSGLSILSTTSTNFVAGFVQNGAGATLFATECNAGACLVAGSAANQGLIYTQNAHALSFGTTAVRRVTIAAGAAHIRGDGTAPALTVCGTTPGIVGNDIHGTVTMGTGTPTGCVITFNVAYVAAPNCNVTWRANPLAAQSYAVSTTAITLTQTATSSNVVDYNCWGN